MEVCYFPGQHLENKDAFSFLNRSRKQFALAVGHPELVLPPISWNNVIAPQVTLVYSDDINTVENSTIKTK